MLQRFSCISFLFKPPCLDKLLTVKNPLASYYVFFIGKTKNICRTFTETEINKHVLSISKVCGLYYLVIYSFIIVDKIADKTQYITTSCSKNVIIAFSTTYNNTDNM